MRKTKNFVRKFLTLGLSVSMVVSMAACGKEDDGDTPAGGDVATPIPGQNADDHVIDTGKALADEQIVKTVYSDEISEWNYLVPSSASTWANYIDHLVEYDNYGLCQPCLAESWTKSDDGLVWTFKIREGVQWQYYDGSLYGADVKAEDWVTTIKYILDPANAARSADLLFVFVGAEDYYDALANNQEADFSTVGVKAISDYELQFTLNAPISYFLSMLQYNWGYPTNAAYLEKMGDEFGTDNQSFLYCGAFLCKDYEPESYRIDYANPNYWDKANIHIEKIERTYNAEASTLEAELYLRGEVTTTDIPSSQLDAWMNDPEKSKMIRPSRSSAYSYFYLFNFWPNFPEEYDADTWLLAANNVNFRKSFYYALDRVAALQVYDPYNPENFILNTITPKNFVAADGKDYTQLGALAEYTNNDQHQEDLALEYKAKAVEELTALGVTFPIKVYMPYNTGSTNQTNLAQVTAQQLMRVLGSDYIDITIEGYPDTDYLNITRRAGNYSFMMSYWGPDYADPITYTDPFVIGQKYNYIYKADGMAVQVGEGEGGKLGFDGNYWKDSVYDTKVAAADVEVVDLAKRYEALAEVEAWLIDQAYVIPLGTLGATGYVASNLNPFESQYAAFGASSDRYKYQYVYAEPFSTEEYNKLYEEWEAERARRIAAAQGAGIDY